VKSSIRHHTDTDLVPLTEQVREIDALQASRNAKKRLARWQLLQDGFPAAVAIRVDHEWRSCALGLTNGNSSNAASTRLVVVQNWLDELKRLAPTN
jgi:hypothetical protein